jgi:phosphohistidine swiveling domain-containing protein
MTLITHLSSTADVEGYAGNKARSLYLLERHGLRVPRWAVLGADLFASFRRKTGFNERAEVLLAQLTAENAEHSAQAITSLILTGDLSAAIRTEIAEAIAYVGDMPLAVRSSSVEEDGKRFSFAGQFDTFLHVQGFDAIETCVRRCWASSYSARALLYRKNHGLSLAFTDMAVVLQELVPARTSGVVFTVNPSNSNTEEIVVSAVYGLGEGLVSGAIDADTIIIDRATLKASETIIGEKLERFEGQQVVSVNDEMRVRLSLDEGELADVVTNALKVEQLFDAPQDIEWCIADGTLWILQARPITSPMVTTRGRLEIWDNSNIVENYPGVSSQLTFTFTRYVYSQVFREFCRKIGIPRRKLSEMDGFLGAVLGYLHGRIYYNLLNWYKLAGLAPFQNLGRKMMEIQMGVSETIDMKDLASSIEAYQLSSATQQRWLRFVSGSRFAWYFLSLKRNTRSFRKFFYKVFERYDTRDYALMDADEIYGSYVAFERQLLQRWGMMIVLESSIGLSYGVLRALIKKWLPDAPEWFEVSVIGGIDTMESVAPARRLTELAQLVRSRPDAHRIVSNLSSSTIYAALRRQGEDEVVAGIEKYIDEFGYRGKNELKLEALDMHEDPELLFDMLKSAVIKLQQQIMPSNVQLGPSTDERVREILDQNLGPWRAWVFERVRSRVRGAIDARETVRFCRSRAFGVARQMFRGIGDALARQGLLESGRDIVHLRLDELRGCFDGSMSTSEIGPLIEMRKRDYAAHQQMEDLPPRFATRGSVTAWFAQPANLQALSRRVTDTGDADLRGTPCCPGVAEGIAKAVSEPNEFDSGILVTYRTDPGWVPVFSSAQALLIERGSPLTHAAIVAREIGLPTIVQIPLLTQRVKSGMRLKVDGHTGRVFFVDEPTSS